MEYSLYEVLFCKFSNINGMRSVYVRKEQFLGKQQQYIYRDSHF